MDLSGATQQAVGFGISDRRCTTEAGISKNRWGHLGRAENQWLHVLPPVPRMLSKTLEAKAMRKKVLNC